MALTCTDTVDLCITKIIATHRMKKKNNILNPKCGCHLTEAIKHFQSLFDCSFLKYCLQRGREKKKTRAKYR